MDNFIFISVFRHDFGSFFLFITVDRYIHWLAMLDWNFHECSLLCWSHLVEGGVELLSGLSLTQKKKKKKKEGKLQASKQQSGQQHASLPQLTRPEPAGS